MKIDGTTLPQTDLAWVVSGGLELKCEVAVHNTYTHTHTF